MQYSERNPVIFTVPQFVKWTSVLVTNFDYAQGNIKMEPKHCHKGDVKGGFKC